MTTERNYLTFKPLGIDTADEHIVYINQNTEVWSFNGFAVLDRLILRYQDKTIIATLHALSTLAEGQLSLSEQAVQALGIQTDQQVAIAPIPPNESMSHVRAKIYGHTLNQSQLGQIVQDIAANRYSNVDLSAFIVACAGGRMTTDEIAHLTQAMIHAGQCIDWGNQLVVDKHCIGGLPGNRTTPIVVAIAAASGLIMPKTSSRAITSPAGTADTLEVLTRVDLNIEEIKTVVNAQGGCFVWGGTSDLSPADDLIIKIEKMLDLDSQAQLIASVLSKKFAAGSRYVVIDIPVGKTAKVRTQAEAQALKTQMEQVAQAIGLQLKVLITDGTQPVGKGIGPALEARDVLAVLTNQPDAPDSLANRSILLAGTLLELANKAPMGQGQAMARQLLTSEKAYQKFQSICNAQGRFSQPALAAFTHDVTATKQGVVTDINNRKIATIAKLAGAPAELSAGVDFLAPIGTAVLPEQTLYTIHAASQGALDHAIAYSQKHTDILVIECIEASS